MISVSGKNHQNLDVFSKRKETSKLIIIPEFFCIADDIPFPGNIYTGKVVYKRREKNVWLMKFMIAQDVAVFIKVLINV